ncbi:MAG: hypothetical protein Q8R02_00635 [Hyphomonadaceae bacterium]|nr:hypothetical protein [Hyphomonadaceae bacterium]
MSIESYEAANLRQFQANNAAAVRQHVAQMIAERSDRKVQGAKNTADLLELGHDSKRASAGARALLLDVLA